MCSKQNFVPGNLVQLVTHYKFIGIIIEVNQLQSDIRVFLVDTSTLKSYITTYKIDTFLVRCLSA